MISKKLFGFAAALMCLVATFSAQAQNLTVRGTVSDAVGPIVGAVVLSGNANAVTDLDGAYTITVPANAVLEVSCLGYTTQQVNVNGRTTINIILVEVLCNGNDVLFPEGAHIICATELADDGVGLPLPGNLCQGLELVGVPEGEGNLGHHPGIMLMGVAHDSLKQFIGIGLRKVRHHQNAGHVLKLFSKIAKKTELAKA